MKTPRILAIGIASLLAITPAFAATFTWDGGSLVDSNIGTASNWNPDAVPANDPLLTNLIFDGTVRLNPNFLAAFGANGVTFNSNAAANPFTFTGSALTIGTAGIVNNDADTQTFGNQITLGTVTTTFNAASGALVFNGTVALGPNTLNVNGAQATTFGGAITGTGVITKSGAGALNVSATATAIGADFNLNLGTTTLAATGTTQTFSASSVIAVNATGTFNINESLTLDGAQLTRASGATVALATGKTLTVQNGGDAIITGSYFQQTTAGTINVTGAGSTFTMSGASAFGGGSTLNITAGGTVSGVSNIDLAVSGGNATVLVDGAGSSFAAGTSFWGYFGLTALVTFANGGSGNFAGGLFVAGSGAGGTGTLNVQTGSTLTVGDLQLANTTDAATATLTVKNAGSLVTQTAGAQLVVGAASGSVGTLNVQTSGIFTTSGTGTTAVNATGTVAITGGTFNANGNMTVIGKLTRNAAGTFALAAGKTLTMQGGGDAIFTGSYNQTTAATINVTGAGSTFTMSGASEFRGGSALNVTAGGSVSGTSNIDLAVNGGNAGILVDGAGSNFAAGAGVASAWGSFGNTALATFANGGSGNFPGGIFVATSTVGTVCTVNVQSGSTLTVGSLFLANTTAAATATLTVNGAGSLVTQNAGASLTIGAASGSTGRLNVQNSGTFTTSGTGMTVDATGTVAITGGTFNANGNMTVNGQLTRDAGGVFNLAAGKTLTVQNGGDAIFSGTYNQATAATITVTGVGSTFSANAVLSLDGGSTTNVLAGGSISTGGQMNVGTNGNGTMTVDGVASSLGAPGIIIGGNGFAGNLTFSNGSTGVPGAIEVDNSFIGGTSGTLSIQSGAVVTCGFLTIATSAAASTGTVTINGISSSLTVTGGSFATIGATSLSTGTLNVQNSGTFTSSAVTTTVNATGTVAITGGTFNANGNMTVNGQLTRDAGGVFNLAAGKTLTVQNGGDAIFTGGYFQTTAAIINVAGAGSTFTMSGNSRFWGGSTLNITAGGSVSNSASYIDLAIGGNATVLVDGTGSSFASLGGGFSGWGFDGTALVTFANGGSGNFPAGIHIAGSSGVGTVNVQSGATLTVGALEVANTTAAAATATLTVNGTGSILTQTAGALLTIGAASSSVGTINAQNSGTFNSGTGATALNATGTINIDGGTVNLAGPLMRNGGALNFNTGALSIVDNFAVGTGGLLGANVAFDATRTFTTTATTTIDATRTLTLNGGTFSTSALVNNGTLDFQRGTLAITGAGGFNIGTGALGANVGLGLGSNLLVTNTVTIAAGATLALNGGTLSAGALVSNGILAFNRGTLAITGAGGFNIGTGALGSIVTLGTGANLLVTNTTTVASGALLRVNGGSFSGAAITNNGTIDHQDGVLDFTGTLNNAAGSRLFVGGLSSSLGAVTNAGRITMENGIGLLGGAGAITNTGLITGDGTIAKPVTNSVGGSIRAEAGKTLFFTGTTGTNNGRLDLLDGTLQFTQQFTNSATGQINGQGALYFPTTPVPSLASPTAGLMNAGTINLTGGDSQIYGTVQMQAGSRLIVSGGATASFFDVFRHSGLDVRASAGSAIVFFGEVRGAGSFSGTGTTYFEGGYSPGNSPALVTFGGSVVYGTFNTVFMELGGTARGTQYDAINVAGKLTFDGGLTVPLISGFQPQAGNVFNLFDFGTKAGTFTTVNLPALAPGLAWSQANLYTAGEIQVALDPVFINRTWDGGGVNNNWITDTNWTLDVQPLNNATADLIFTGNVRLAPSVDTPWNVRSITFNNAAEAFTITGPQGITIGNGGIVNNDPQTQTITAAITLSAHESFNAAAGDLAITSVALAGQTLTITGANDVTLATASGTGIIDKNNAGRLDITGILGTGGVTLHANTGATNIGASETLAVLNIGNGATVTLGAIAPSPAPEFGDGAEFLGAPALPVPEPGIGALLASALTLLARRKRAGRSQFGVATSPHSRSKTAAA